MDDSFADDILRKHPFNRMNKYESINIAQGGGRRKGGKEGKEEPRNIAFHNILLCRTVSQLETFSFYSRQKGLCLSPPGHFLSCTTNNRIIPKFNQTFFFFYEKSIQILKFKSCPSNRFQINPFFLDKFEKTFAHSS